MTTEEVKAIFIKMLTQDETMPNSYLGLVCYHLTENQKENEEEQKNFKDILKCFVRGINKELYDQKAYYEENFKDTIKNLKEIARLEEIAKQLRWLQKHQNRDFYLFVRYADKDCAKTLYKAFKKNEELYKIAKVKTC